MKILIVGSLNSHAGNFAPFIVEQAESLCAKGCEVEHFGIVGKGIMGYIRNAFRLQSVIRHIHPDIIHAHYGLCGLVACIATIISAIRGQKIPVLTTYHGSDINNPKAFRFSRLAIRLSSWNIFVSQRTMSIAKGERLKNASLIPCGITIPPSASELPDMSHVLEPCKKHVLFAGAFDNVVKDPDLAKQVVDIINQKFNIPTQLIEIKGYTRDEVSALMYACDAFLMTSKTEGSPQVIKEAMVCGCPIVSVDVGDVAERTAGLEGCFVSNSRDPKELADLLSRALAYGKRTDGRKLIIQSGLTNELVVAKLVEQYEKVMRG